MESRGQRSRRALSFKAMKRLGGRSTSSHAVKLAKCAALCATATLACDTTALRTSPFELPASTGDPRNRPRSQRTPNDLAGLLGLSRTEPGPLAKLTTVARSRRKHGYAGSNGTLERCPLCPCRNRPAAPNRSCLCCRRGGTRYGRRSASLERPQSSRDTSYS